MPAQKYPPLNLAVISALYGCSESFVKRMSANGVDLRDPKQVEFYLKDHARSQTRAKIEASASYFDAFAALNGIRKESIAEMAKAGINIRDGVAVRTYLAGKRKPRAVEARPASNVPLKLLSSEERNSTPRVRWVDGKKVRSQENHL
jgi:hypothetical protein